MQKLSVIIPAYNEEKRIPKTLEAVSDFLSKQQFGYEILVVDDGSKDKTVETVKNLQGSIKNLQIIENAENHGKGWVTMEGMLKASGDIRVFMDADNSTKVDEICKMLPYFEQGYDVVVGSRRIQGSVIAVKQPFYREFLGWAFRTIVHTIVSVGVTDTQCGFKAFTGKAAQDIFHKQTIFRWAFDVEILAIARKLKYKIKEVPVTWVDDAQSHVKFSGMVKMLLEVLQVRANLIARRYSR